MDEAQKTEDKRITPGFLAQAGKGRPKGVLNKTTQAAKDAIAEAADGLGGAKRLMEWASENPKNEAAFWTQIYPKLLPLQLTGHDGGAIKFEKVLEDADAVASAIASLAERARANGVAGETQH